jgi:hypothetical protein
LKDLTGLGPKENQAALMKIFNEAVAITEASSLSKANIGTWGTKAHQATNTTAKAMRAGGHKFFSTH